MGSKCCKGGPDEDAVERQRRQKGLDDSVLVEDVGAETDPSAAAGPVEGLRHPGAGDGQAPVLHPHVAVPAMLPPNVQCSLLVPGPREQPCLPD
ncbi:IQCF3 isoform 2 [Pan troglodytes]|uniref:IQ motif containing F3 n=2 Tax=Homininae TaxID=207598 RepID=F2Z334_HUMAN|nr:IQ motif containing F3 [Homo sapiens]KAI4029930.1 IQ motif containing F3 [Homo sapiens]PNI80394.1 IQCF3 isoform 2 [Pan troglodytes]